MIAEVKVYTTDYCPYCYRAKAANKFASLHGVSLA